MPKSERFRTVASGIQSVAVAVAVVIGGGWTLYTFNAFDEIERRTTELESLRRSLEQRGILDIQMDTDQLPGDGNHNRYIVVNVAITNRGNRTEAFDWSTGGVSVARASMGASYEPIQGAPIHAQYTVVGEVPETSTVLPGQSRRFPFLVGLDEGGLYQIQFLVEVSPLEVPDAMAEHLSVNPDTLRYTYIWSQTSFEFIQ